MMEGNNAYMKYMQTHKHTKVSDGTVSIDQLPLIKVEPKSKKSFKEFFQVIRNVSDVDVAAIRSVMSEASPKYAHLPASVRPRDALGDSCVLQLVLEKSAHASWTVLKFYHSTVSIPMGLAKTLCNNNVLTIDYKICSNSDVVKKGFMKMLSKIPGDQWLTQEVVDKPQIQRHTSKDGDNKTWNPDEEELRCGIAYINEHAPLANAHNEQYLWVLLNIRDEASPLYGWPSAVVQKACANRSSGNCQSEPEWFFPLLLFDLNPKFLKSVVPLVLPYLPNFGLMVLGRAGIGKTPTAQIMTLAVARHLISVRGLSGMAGWRRSKQIDGFRERPGEVNVPVLLDDPNLSAINFEDIKSFLDVGETCLVDARYKPAKFVRNQCRVILNNEWDETKEPDLSLGDTITWEQFQGMFAVAIQYAKHPHMMAILKRAAVIIAGRRAVYLRLPSQNESETIYRFSGDGITEDWLCDKNKSSYGSYKQGVHQKYANYDSQLDEEAALVAKLLATPEEKAYMERAEKHDQWRREAAPVEPEAPASPRPSPIALKEEIISPATKRARTAFGVIDVEGEENNNMETDAIDIAPVAAPDPMGEEEEDVFGFGGGFEAPA